MTRTNNKLDLGGMSDSELAGLMDEMRQETNRRNNNGGSSNNSVQSRWIASFLLLCVAFVFLFKAETSGIDRDLTTDDVKNQIKKKTLESIAAAWLSSEEKTDSHRTDKKELSNTLKDSIKDTIKDREGEEEDAKLAAAAKKAVEEAFDAKKAEQEAAAKKAIEDAFAAKKADAAAKKAHEEDSKAKRKADEEAAAAKIAEEEKQAAKKTEEEAKKIEEELAAKKATEEAAAAAQKAEEEAVATTKAQQDAAAALSLALAHFPLNKADDATKQAELAKGTRPKVRYQYKPRSYNLKDANHKTELAAKWGSWTLADPKARGRPTHDFAKDFPSRDIPWDKFPSNAWQIDKEYLPKFLTESQELVDRALEAMMGEYGWSKFDLPDQDFPSRVVGTSFEVLELNLTVDDINQGKGYKGSDKGGWISHEYFAGLKRRLMHSVITGDTFTLVMGGHSAAAGHGNHFQQSYTLQFFKVMEPILARLGVKLHTMNHGYGGLGTGQNAFAAGDLYGKEIDILVWDSQMTENSNEQYDVFARQGLLSGNRIPLLMHGMKASLHHMWTTIDAEVAMFGDGKKGVPECTNDTMAQDIMWAARYLRCNGEMHPICRGNEYNGTCWIDREDYTPTTTQSPAPGGRASWHPGFRQHAIRGRILAFTVLRALLEGLKEWQESPDQKLPEEKWHVHNHYENIRTKLKARANSTVDPEGGSFCFDYKELKAYPFCTHPFNGVGEMTPRANPRETSIRNIMKPAYNGYVPVPEESVYNPPDVFNPTLELPEGEFDYLAVVENGIDYTEVLTFDNSPLPYGYGESKNRLIPLGIPDIQPGLGWYADSNANPDECDGSFDGFCGRSIRSNCLLYGHNDHRGGLGFDSFSGWGVFTVPNVKLGVIMVRLESWHSGAQNPITAGWQEVNNGDKAFQRRLSSRRLSSSLNATATKRTRRLGAPPSRVDYDGFHQDHRMLKGGTPLCDDFVFEFAVNGKITSYNSTQFGEHLNKAQRVVHLQEILNDETVTNGEPCDIEIAMRMRSSQKINLFLLSNIYWA